jgi:rubrerythrin
MAEQGLSLLGALRVAMEAERKAAVYYADAARRASNPMTQGLFHQLVEFERYHKLAELETSLRNQGGFIRYEGREMVLPTPGDMPGVKEVEQMSVMDAVTAAIELERESETRYTALARQVTDPEGRAMFERLAGEEQTHARLLQAAYWNLNDTGVWKWTR